MKFIEVSAEVRYWEDADVNSVQDDDGSLIPCRNGNLWCPVIRLSDGLIINWDVGREADIHYKVCDQGEYWLLDSTTKRSHKYKGYYVPAAKVYHIGSASSGSKFNPFTIRLSTRNSIYVLIKHYSLLLFLRFLPVIVIYQFFWFLFTIKKGHFWAYCQGLGEALRGLSKMRNKRQEIARHDRLTTAEFAAVLRQAETATFRKSPKI